MHSWGGEGSWDRGRRCLGPLTPGAPPWPHLARSFPGDYPCSSTSPQGQVPVRCELGREQPEPLSWAPPSPPRPQGLLPRPQALPAVPSAAQSTSAPRLLRRAAAPIPGEASGKPLPSPGAPLSQLLSSLWDPVLPGLPAFLSSPRGVLVPKYS